MVDGAGERTVSPSPSETFRCDRGRSTPLGTFLCGWGQSARWRTGILSPGAQDVPTRKKAHPDAQNVPGGAACTRLRGMPPSGWCVPGRGGVHLDGWVIPCHQRENQRCRDKSNLVLNLGAALSGMRPRVGQTLRQESL